MSRKVGNRFLSLSMQALTVQLQLLLMTYYVYINITVATCTVFLILGLWSLSRNRYSSEETTKQVCTATRALENEVTHPR